MLERGSGAILNFSSAAGFTAPERKTHYVTAKAAVFADSSPVFETLDDGRRVPLDRVRVELDGLLGMGVVIATTMTDAEGRYVLCGLGNEREPYLFAARAGYRMFGGPVRIDGNTIVDIEMQH